MKSIVKFAGFALLISSSAHASAGRGLTVNFDNVRNASISVLTVDSTTSVAGS